MSAQVGNWDDLRFFLAVARHGRLSAAADELEVNHSTVFRRIAGLEERLGTRLFDRHSSGHRLTSAGEELLGVTERIEEEVLGASRQVEGRDRELRGIVRVTCADFGNRLSSYFQQFVAAHPGVDLEVLVDNRFLSLHRREADVALRPGARPTEPDLVARKVASLRFGIYASTDYLAQRGRPRRYADLANHDIVTGDDSLAHMPTTRWLERHAGKARVRYRTNNVMNWIAAVVSGCGIGALPCYGGDDEPNLERLFLPDDMDCHDLWLVYHGDLRQTARVRAFIAHLADTIAADADRFAGKR